TFLEHLPAGEDFDSFLFNVSQYPAGLAAPEEAGDKDIGVADNPFHLRPEDVITTLFTHAGELIEIEGVTYISSCGIEDPQIMNFTGLWIAKLKWMEP
ncbi:MAG: hypothetical protein IIB56_20055, partial [Planctomycetes bacterium]|nr:hypothetical protein [Planctomycetota bacterium]